MQYKDVGILYNKMYIFEHINQVVINKLTVSLI